VSAPFTCSDRSPTAMSTARSRTRVPAGSCREAYGPACVPGAWRCAAGDVTADAMPAMPQVTKPIVRASWRVRAGSAGSQQAAVRPGHALVRAVSGDGAEGRRAPTVTGTASTSRSWSGPVIASSCATRSRAQWPCDPVAPGDRACGGFPDSGPDLFVTAGASRRWRPQPLSHGAEAGAGMTGSRAVHQACRLRV
jgi:hypothetical protein